MLKRCLAVGCLLFASPSLADQCAWNSRPVADAAVKLLPKGSTVQSFCAPCKETKAEKVVVEKSTVESAGEPNFFKVDINGASYDLAYLYVKKAEADASYTNLGLLVQCTLDKDSVPLELPAAVVAK